MAPRKAQASNFRSDIHALRALSVLLVVLYHFGIPRFGGGFIGVDVFFVISGYLMTKIIVTDLEERRFSYLRFLLARASRIVPALFALILVLLLVGTWWLPPVDLRNLANEARYAAAFLSNQHYHDTQEYFGAGPEDRWLLHTWSLSVEWQFYMLYPLLLAVLWRLLPSKLDRAAKRRSAIFCLLSALVASLAYGAHTADTSPPAGFFLLPSRAWEMLAGGLVFLFESHLDGVPMRRRRLLSVAGLLAILVTAPLASRYHWSDAWPGFMALLPVGGTALVLWSAALPQRLVEARVLQALGRWSYSVYLWHWPVVVALLITDLLKDRFVLAAPLGMAASVFLGWLSFRLIESRPLLSALPAPAGLAMAATAAGVIIVAGSFTVDQDGFPARAEPALAGLQQQMLAADKSDYYPAHCLNADRPPDQWRTCRVRPSANEERAVLVVGDSHAEHLYAWFAAHARTPVDVFAKRGCPIVPGTDYKNGRRCGEFAQAAHKIAVDGGYRTVIYSAAWQAFGPSSPAVCLTGPDGVCRRMVDPSAYFAQLERMFTALLDRGIEVVVLDESPKSPFIVPRRLAREAFWFGALRPGSEEAAVLPKSQPFDALVQRLAREHAGFHLVSLRSELCVGDGRCRVKDPHDDIPVFHDRDHFNPAWIAAHGRVLAPYVEPLQVSPPSSR